MAASLAFAKKPKTFSDLVEQAGALHKAGQRRTPFPPTDPRNERLTVQAALKEALANASTTHERLDHLEDLLARQPNDTIEVFIQAVMTGMTTLDPMKGFDLRPIAAGFHHRLGVAPNGFVDYAVGMMQIGTSALEIVALAVRRAVQQRPEAFGVVESWDKNIADMKARDARYAELIEQIPDAATMSDLELRWVDRQDSLARVFYRWRGQEIGIPLADVNALVALAAA